MAGMSRPLAAAGHLRPWFVLMVVKVDRAQEIMTRSRNNYVVMFATSVASVPEASVGSFSPKILLYHDHDTNR